MSTGLRIMSYRRLLIFLSKIFLSSIVPGLPLEAQPVDSARPSPRQSLRSPVKNSANVSGSREPELSVSYAKTMRACGGNRRA